MGHGRDCSNKHHLLFSYSFQKQDKKEFPKQTITDVKTETNGSNFLKQGFVFARIFHHIIFIILQ